MFRTYFDDPWKIEDLTKSKNFCGKLLQKTSCIILVMVLGALTKINLKLQGRRCYEMNCTMVHWARGILS